MKLSNAEIRPGKVLKVVDNYGTIKAACCGLFDENDDPTLLPPIYPMFKLSPTGFTKPHEGDEIWVWYFKDNPQELFYMFQGDVSKYNGNFLEAGQNDVEVISKHKINDEEEAAHFYDTDNGWMMKYGDTIINLNTNHDIIIKKADDRIININNSGIHLGKGDTMNPAVKGNEAFAILMNIKAALITIQNTAMSNPMTAPIGTALAAITPTLDSIEKIKSEKVFVD